MRIPQGKNRIPRVHRRKKRDQNESRENTKNNGMADADHNQKNSQLHKIGEF